MAVPSTAADLSTTAASNSPAGSESIGTSLDDYLRAIQAIIKAENSKGADIASASTIDVPSAGSYFVVTGTTGIGAISDDWTGRLVTLKFSDAVVLTHSAGLILPTGANITTAAGDVFGFVNESSGVWRCVFYQPATGYQAKGSYQPLDADLTALAGLTSAANKVPMFSGSGTATLIDFKDEDNMASDSATAVPSQQSVKAYVTSSVSGSALTLGTAVATTSGTAHEFTGIPAGTKEIIFQFNGVSLSGTNDLLVQIGDSGGPESTGYVSNSATAGGDVSSTAGFIVRAGANANVSYGHMRLTLFDAAAFTWVASHSTRVAATAASSGGGSKSLTAELTQIRVVATGADTFDAGSINILYK